MLLKRRYSHPAAAGGKNANLDITTSRQTEKTVTKLCSFAIIWWLFEFVRFFKIDGIWGPEGGVSRRRVKEFSFVI